MKKIMKQLMVLVVALTMLLPSNISYAQQQNTYQLSNIITRAEFAAMLNEELGLTKLSDKPFYDVRSTQWYDKDLRIAKAAGYLLGMDNKVSPTGKLTRQDCALMLARAYKVALEEVTSTTYLDDYTISKSAKSAVETLKNLKVMPSEPIFDGKEYITFKDAIDYINKLENALSKPKYVFFLIGDGMGASHRALAEYYEKYITKRLDFKLAMNQLPVASAVTTDCLNSYITDSAAAGTALATGHKTNSGIISMDAKGEVAYKTLLEAAQENGMATGADKFHFNPSYLSRCFKKILGINFNHIVQEARLKQACRLLTHTNNSIEEIVHKVGYSNINYFYRIFRKEYKITPAEFRKENNPFGNMDI